MSLRSSLRASQESKGKHFQNVPRCLPVVLPGKPARPCPLPLLPSPAGLRDEAGGHGGSPRGADAPPPRTRTCWERRLSPVPGVGGPWSLQPAPATRDSAHWALPLSLAEPGRATASLLEPRRGGGMRLSEPSGFVREGAGQRQMHRFFFFFFFSLRLARVRAPNPSSRPRVLWLGPAGSVGRESRASGGSSQVSGLPSAARPPPKASGGPPPPLPELRTARTAGAGKVTATWPPPSGSARVRAKVRGGGGEGLSPRPSGSSGGCG